MSHLWENEKEGEKKEKGRKEKGKGHRKGMEGMKEGRRNKKRKKDRKEEGIQGERRKEKKKASAGFKPVRLVQLVFLSVELGGGGWKVVSLFSLPEPHSWLLFSLQSSSSGSFCSPLGL